MKFDQINGWNFDLMAVARSRSIGAIKVSLWSKFEFGAKA